TNNDSGTIATDIDNAMDAVLAGLTPNGGSGKCAATKLKGAAKATSGEIKCYAKAAKSGAAVVFTCLESADIKLNKAWLKAEGGSVACPTTGDHDAIEAQMDAFMLDVVAALLFPGSGFPEQWTEQGPGPDTVPGSYGYTKVSGAINGIAADPTNADRVFV